MIRLTGPDRLQAAEIAARIEGTCREVVPLVVAELVEIGLLPDGEERSHGFVQRLRRELDALRAEFGGESARKTPQGGISGEMGRDNVFRVGSDVYRGAMPTKRPQRFTGWLRLEGDFMVLNDIHIPATNWDFAERALDMAYVHLPTPRRCIIAGDLINGDAMSHWDDLVLCTPLADELTYAEAYLAHIADVFDEIYFIRGNHEARLLYGMRGQLNAPQFRRMITDNQRVIFSIYPKMTVLSGGQEWFIAHQRNYSRNPLTVGRKLAEKRKANIIATHQHHSAIGRDPSNSYTIVDSGGLHDSELMAYVQLEETTAPVMTNGFVLLRDGVATLFTPEDYNMTDWSMWDFKERIAA